MTLQELVFGRRLENREYQARKLGVLEAVPAMGLDALGSSAYGPEAALAALAIMVDYVLDVALGISAGVGAW